MGPSQPYRTFITGPIFLCSDVPNQIWDHYRSDRERPTSDPLDPSSIPGEVS